jgi:tetratricopeptide (TPR) repeat protein
MPKSEIANVPHTAATDHRIIRNRDASSTPSNTGKSWSVFDNAEERIPAWEVSRARGLAMMDSALSQQAPSIAMKARQYLLGDLASDATPKEIIAELGIDVPALAAIGSSFWLCDQRDMARPIWLRILELDPNNETALSGLTLLDVAANDLTSAERYAKQLVATTPSEARHWVQLSNIHWKMGRRDEALKNAEKAIQLDPSLDDVRKWIASPKEVSPNP